MRALKHINSFSRLIWERSPDVYKDNILGRQIPDPDPTPDTNKYQFFFFLIFFCKRYKTHNDVFFFVILSLLFTYLY